MPSSILTSEVTPDGCIHTPVPVAPPEYRTGLIPVPTLIAMSRRENELRFSEDVQRHFKEGYEARRLGKFDDPRFGVDILTECQLQVLEEFGFARDDESRLYELRTAAFQHPDVAELQEVVYIKYNRCADCQVADGDVAPDVTLHDPTTLAPASLHTIVARNAPRRTFFVSASYT